MGRVTRRVPRTRWDLQQHPGAIITRPDTVAVEEPLEIRVDGTSVTTTMRTPGDDFDLALGHLLTEGVLRHGTRRAHDDALPRPGPRRLPHLQRRRRHPRARRVDCSAQPARNQLHDQRVRGVRQARASTRSPPTPVCGVDDRSASACPLRRGRRAARRPARTAEGVRASTGGLHAAGLFTPEGDAAGGPRGRRAAQRRRQGDRLGRPRGAAAAGRPRARRERTGRASSSCRRPSRPASPRSSRSPRRRRLAVELATETGLTLVGFARRTAAHRLRRRAPPRPRLTRRRTAYVRPGPHTGQ